MGLGIGLSIEVPNRYGVDNFQALKALEQKELIDSVYPHAGQLAIELKQWLLNGTIKLTGAKDEILNRWQYIDNRTDEDKVSRVWKVSGIDQTTGEIRAETNVLMDKNGGFIRGHQPEGNWWRKLMHKIKLNR